MEDGYMEQITTYTTMQEQEYGNRYTHDQK